MKAEVAVLGSPSLTVRTFCGHPQSSIELDDKASVASQGSVYANRTPCQNKNKIKQNTKTPASDLFTPSFVRWDLRPHDMLLWANLLNLLCT